MKNRNEDRWENPKMQENQYFFHSKFTSFLCLYDTKTIILLLIINILNDLLPVGRLQGINIKRKAKAIPACQPARPLLILFGAVTGVIDNQAENCRGF